MSNDLIDLPASETSEDRLNPKDVVGHLLLVQPLRTGTTEGKYGEQPHVDLHVRDLSDGDRLYRSVRFFGGSLHDPLSAVLGRKLAVVPELRNPKSSAAQPYAALRAATPDEKARAAAFLSANTDPFGELGDLPADVNELVAPVQQAVAPSAQPSPEQTVAATLGATPVQEAAPAGPTEQDIIRAKALIAIPGIEDHVVLASVPGLTPAIVASLRTAAGS